MEPTDANGAIKSRLCEWLAFIMHKGQFIMLSVCLSALQYISLSPSLSFALYFALSLSLCLQLSNYIYILLGFVWLNYL